MLVSLSGCGCYLDLSPGNNKGTLCSSVWHQRPTWTGKEGGGKELAPKKEGWEREKKKRQRQSGMVKNKEEKKKEGRVLRISGKRRIERKSERGVLGSNRVSTCWEIADSLAVRDYCHVKRTVKKKEIGPAVLLGSQLGLPGDEESIENKKYSRRPHRGAVYHLESVFVSFSSGKGIYLLSSVP